MLAEVSGKVRYEDCVEGVTIRREKEKSGNVRLTVTEYKGDLHPQIVLVDAEDKILDFYYLPERASIDAKEGDEITAGTVLARNPRESAGTQDITGGLPRVTELFEARTPKEPAVIAEVGGVIEFVPEKKRGKRIVKVIAPDGSEVEHAIPPGKPLLVHAGDEVKAGDALVRGPLKPHDILRIGGTEEVQDYLRREIQGVYQAQRVEIDDKHIEIVISQMLRKLKIEDPGDTTLLPGVLVDKTEFVRVNEQLQTCLKVTHPGDTDFDEGDIVPKETLEEVNGEVEASGADPAETCEPRRAVGSTQLLGITKAAVQSESFISAASFQETTKVLTEAALAGKSDGLVGLKENVILGHLIPAGTGFRIHQDAEVRIHDSALMAMQAEKERILAQRRDLLAEVAGEAAPAPLAEESAPADLLQRVAAEPEPAPEPAPAAAEPAEVDGVIEHPPVAG